MIDILCSWVTLVTRVASYVYSASYMYTLYKLHKLRSHCHASGSLHLDNVKSIVLDWNWRDKKFKRMADIVDTRRDLMLLMQTYLIPHIHKNKCKIGILWLCVSSDVIWIKELPIPRANTVHVTVIISSWFWETLCFHPQWESMNIESPLLVGDQFLWVLWVNTHPQQSNELSYRIICYKHVICTRSREPVKFLYSRNIIPQE